MFTRDRKRNKTFRLLYIVENPYYTSLWYCWLFYETRSERGVEVSLGQKKVPFSISFLHHLICCFKKTKYTTRCSVKRTIIYKVKLILILYFLFSKKQNCVRPILDGAKKSFFSMRTRNSFFLISSFYYLICFCKKK